MLIIPFGRVLAQHRPEFFDLLSDTQVLRTAPKDLDLAPKLWNHVL